MLIKACKSQMYLLLKQKISVFSVKNMVTTKGIVGNQKVLVNEEAAQCDEQEHVVAEIEEQISDMKTTIETPIEATLEVTTGNTTETHIEETLEVTTGTITETSIEAPTEATTAEIQGVLRTYHQTQIYLLPR